MIMIYWMTNWNFRNFKSEKKYVSCKGNYDGKNTLIFIMIMKRNLFFAIKDKI